MTLTLLKNLILQYSEYSEMIVEVNLVYSQSLTDLTLQLRARVRVWQPALTPNLMLLFVAVKHKHTLRYTDSVHMARMPGPPAIRGDPPGYPDCRACAGLEVRRCLSDRLGAQPH